MTKTKDPDHSGRGSRYVRVRKEMTKPFPVAEVQIGGLWGKEKRPEEPDSESRKTG